MPWLALWEYFYILFGASSTKNERRVESTRGSDSQKKWSETPFLLFYRSEYNSFISPEVTEEMALEFGLQVTSTIAYTRTSTVMKYLPCLATLYELQSFRKPLSRLAAVETTLTMIITSFTAIEKPVHCSVYSYRNPSAKWIGLPLLYRFV